MNDRTAKGVRPLALVTGASSGIGAAFVRRLAADGFDLVLVARRKNRLEELAKDVGDRHGVSAEVLVADLSEDDGIKAVEARIAAAERLEFLVNNAGFGTRGRFFEIDKEGPERMHRLHVLATLRLNRAALAGMVARRCGCVVNVSSVAAFGQSPGNVGYCATKSWMNSFTEGLSLELSSIGSPVKVQALCPGFTLTEFHGAMGVDRKSIPDSLWMSAEDVVEASLRGLARGKTIVVPGWRYRVYVNVWKFLPRFLRHALALQTARRRR